MQTLNEVTIVGMLLENNLTKDSFNGKNCIRGNTVLSVGDSRVRVDSFSNEFTTNGGVNTAYSNLTALMNNGKCFVPENPNQEVSCVKITKATISNNDYYDSNNILQPVVRINGNFAQTVKSFKPEDILATFEFVGVIESMIPEIKNDTKTGRLQVNITGIEYNGAANPITIMIPKEDGRAEGFGSVFQVGQTTKIGGNIINTMQTTKVTEQVGWGTPTEKTVTTVTREFIGLGGSNPFPESDPSYITPEILAEAKQKREANLLAAKAKSDAKATQKPTNSGFGGNANAFNQATQQAPNNPFAGGSGRPMF